MKQILVIAVLTTVISPFALSQSNSKKGIRNEPREDVMLLNQGFGEAQVRRDIAILDRLLADDFTLVNPAGKVLNKPQFLADMSSGDLGYEFLNYDDTGSKVYGDVVLITGRVVRKGQYKGQDNSGQLRFIHVFVRHQGRWQIVVAQATRISQ